MEFNEGCRMIRVFLYNLATDKYKGNIAGILKCLLFILSLIYGFFVIILSAIYRIKPYRLNCRVISVGNITLGGTGKTVLVELIAGYLKECGHKVAILSRGYKRVTESPSRKVTRYEIMGDEPYMLSKKLEDIPVIVDADRIRAAKRAIKEYGADSVILDDGFQQWKIKKDLEVVAIDAGNPFGNRSLIPRGILRESFSSLKRADVFVLTKVNFKTDPGPIKDVLAKINPSAVIVESFHDPLGFYNLGGEAKLSGRDSLKGENATLFCGIADPASFEDLIKGLGINVGLFYKFPDHHNYTREDLNKIIHASKDKNIAIIITTEKDAVRLENFPFQAFDCKFLALRIEAKIAKGGEIFYDRLLKLYSV